MTRYEDLVKTVSDAQAKREMMGRDFGRLVEKLARGLETHLGWPDTQIRFFPLSGNPHFEQLKKVELYLAQGHGPGAMVHVGEGKCRVGLWLDMRNGHYFRFPLTAQPVGDGFMLSIGSRVQDQQFNDGGDAEGRLFAEMISLEIEGLAEKTAAGE